MPTGDEYDQCSSKKNYIDVIAREFLTSGSVNAYTVAFSFDSIWDGLDRTAVFQAGDSKISVILDDTNQCQIPWEVLENPRRTLEGGVTMYSREYATPKIVESLGPITYMNIQKSNVARLPLGTEIKLYGVRA